MVSKIEILRRRQQEASELAITLCSIAYSFLNTFLCKERTICTRMQRKELLLNYQWYTLVAATDSQDSLL